MWLPGSTVHCTSGDRDLQIVRAPCHKKSSSFSV
uniref:Uncharacterized protein n=1 Tax=Anguilla anguilla TaxID=7936 RepID=A0A0E9V3A3_ANGAN